MLLGYGVSGSWCSINDPGQALRRYTFQAGFSKFVFDLRRNSEGEDALYGYIANQPNWKVIMKKKKS
jgi:hypothetical protein